MKVHGIWINILVSVVPFAILFFFLFSMMGNMGGSNKEDIKVRFSDVAGAEEENKDLLKLLNFWKIQNDLQNWVLVAPAGVF